MTQEVKLLPHQHIGVTGRTGRIEKMVRSIDELLLQLK